MAKVRHEALTAEAHDVLRTWRRPHGPTLVVTAVAPKEDDRRAIRGVALQDVKAFVAEADQGEAIVPFRRNVMPPGNGTVVGNGIRREDPERKAKA